MTVRRGGSTMPRTMENLPTAFTDPDVARDAARLVWKRARDLADMEMLLDALGLLGVAR